MRQQNELVSSLPKKRVKMSNESNNDEGKDAEKTLFCKCYSQKQIDDIQSAMVGIKEYTKYISIMIRHQEKGIATLPKHIIEMEQFKQLRERVNKCIQRARINNQFLDTIAKSYSENLHSAIEAQNFQNKSNQITPNSIIYLFLQVIKQWSQFSKANQNPIQQVISLMRKYSIHYIDPFSAIEGPFIFVHGAGMGRILCEITQNLNPKPRIIEGCEDRVLHYLCGQYFLKKYKTGQKHKIYPYIHDFRNRHKSTQVYEQFEVPQWPYQMKQSKHKEDIYLNFGAFQQNYASNEHNDQWDILVSYICNDRIMNVLKWIQIAYKGLRDKGLWIIVCYSSFEKNVVPISYNQFFEILKKTQFKVLDEFMREQKIVLDRGMTEQRVKTHYIVLEK